MRPVLFVAGIAFAVGACGEDLTSADYNPAAPPPAADAGTRSGMTWVHKGIDAVTGAVRVGCDVDRCDPYEGDTSCGVALPVLCFLPLDADEPAGIDVSDPYYLWSGGVVATTTPVAPADAGLTTLEAVTEHCRAAFGQAWRIAEFHDGWGWNFLAYGNMGDADRVWVDILDQPNATCWQR